MKSSLLILILIACGQCMPQGLTRFVNPFIGTSNGGNTFPGAVRPWGMVSVSPHTAIGAPSGYLQGSRNFYGFGQVHLSGTGCPELGGVVITATRGALVPEPEQYRSRYTAEVATPGYYAVTLIDPDVRAEATATIRCGMIRLTPRRNGDLNILVDAGRSLNMVGGGAVTIAPDGEITGYNIGGRFCGWSNKDTVYFALRTQSPSSAHGTWQGPNCTDAGSVTASDTSLGAWLRIHGRRNQPILLKVGISYVSVRNAQLNLDREIPHWSFERVRTDARDAWERELARIRVEDGAPADFVKFYTALYHVLIHPSIISDVNGEFPRMNRSGIGKYENRERYSVFSLWDTYRTVHPLLTLVYPERQSAIVNTMIDMYRESGWLPKWELAGNETHMMVGDPAVPVIADSYVKGITDFDARTALEAMRKPGDHAGEPDALPARPGYHEFLKYGYIPFEQNTNEPWWVWGPVSNTLEYCLADWTLAQMARALNEPVLASEHQRRSLFYKNLFDSTSQFIRPRRRSGAWLAPFDPLATEGSGSWSGSGGPGYVEGNAWQYTWFVPHDVPGLAALFGGKDAFVAKLAECFRNRHFTINNEPDIAYPYLFTYFPGEEHRTREILRSILNEDFGTGPGGLPGNDDAGTISGWFVFSSLGFYPACPASDAYQLGIPLFGRSTISLSSPYARGEKFVIRLKHLARPEQGNCTVTFNGTPLESYAIPHTAVVSGGTLLFETDTTRARGDHSP